jgi:sulfoxide reductase heme-binding subunit YedZ
VGARLWRALGARLAAAIGSRWFKPVVFVACLLPGLLLSIRFYNAITGRDPGALGADPTKLLEHETGRYALAILLVTLAVTPIRRLFGVNRIQAVRRMLGLWAFAYAVMHVMVYLYFDQLCYSLETCQFPTIWEDLTRRPFIFVGMTAFSLLALLALTSTNGWMRRLRRNWQRLHRLVYVAAIAGVVHFAWGQKADVSEPLQWAAFLAVMFGIRVFYAVRKRTGRLVAAVSR